MTNGWEWVRSTRSLHLQSDPGLGTGKSMGSVAWKSKVYSLNKITIHSPAQHRINGELADLEGETEIVADRL